MADDSAGVHVCGCVGGGGRVCVWVEEEGGGGTELLLLCVVLVQHQEICLVPTDRVFPHQEVHPCSGELIHACVVYAMN